MIEVQFSADFSYPLRAGGEYTIPYLITADVSLYSGDVKFVEILVADTRRRGRLLPRWRAEAEKLALRYAEELFGE